MFDPTNFNPNTRGDVGFGLKPRKNAQNFENYRIWNGGGGGGVQFGLETMEEESGVCSPPMWKTSSNNSSNYRDLYLNLSPTSRAQAIARGQLELMEMVKNMPETSYELSLKDIVEHRERDNREQPSLREEDLERSILGHGQSENQRWKVIKKQESNKKGKIVRSGSMDQNRGLLINLVFPFSFGSKKKKKTSLTKNTSTTCAKVSPKPESLDKKYSVERDWWKRKFSVYSDSEGGGSISGSTTGRSGSSGSSGSSGGSSSRSNSGRKNSGCMPTGCWPSSIPRKGNRQSDDEKSFMGLEFLCHFDVQEWSIRQLLPCHGSGK